MLQLGNPLNQRLYEYIDNHCIFRANPETHYFPHTPKGSIIPGGNLHNTMTWCFYMRRLTHNPDFLHAISYSFAKDIIIKASHDEEFKNVQLCGLETSSIPLVIATQLAFHQAGIHVNSFTVKKDRKEYGLCNLIDGIPNEHPVVMIDDVFNSGRSAGYLYDACLYELGLQPAKNAYFIVSRTEGKMKFNDHDIKINTIFMKEDFDKTYDASKYWLPKDCEMTHNKRPD